MSRDFFIHIDENQYVASNIYTVNLPYFSIRSSYYDLFSEYLPPIASIKISSSHFAPTNEMINYQQEIINITSKRELLPLAVRYIDRYDNYYVERPPFKININYKNDRAIINTKERVEDLQMWVPWTIMTIPSSFANNFDVNKIRMLFSYKSLEKSTDLYISSFLPNSYSDGRICWSNSFNSVSSLDTTKNDIKPFDLTYWHSLIMNDYMMGGWNSDLHSRILSSFKEVKRFPGYVHIKNFIDDKNFADNYPFLNKFINVSDYPDLADHLCNICVDKFNMSLKRAKSVIFGSSGKSSSGKSKDADYYVHFFAYMSTLSLEETLKFYEEVTNFIKNVSYHRSSDSYTHYSDYVFKFSKICKENILEVQDDSSFVEGYFPTTLPLSKYLSSSKALENGDATISSLKNKNTSLYIIFDNLTQSQYNTLNQYHYSPDIFSLLKLLSYDISNLVSTFARIINSTEERFFIRIDLKSKDIIPISYEDFKEYIDALKSVVSTKIQEFESSVDNSKKKISNAMSIKLQRISYIKRMQNESSALDSFKLY